MTARVEQKEHDAAQLLIEEMLRTALWLFDISASLLDDLPDEAFPGEDSGEVMLEMLAGSCRPAIASAGDEGCRIAIELLTSIRENVLNDLRAAVELARKTEMLH